MNKSDALKMIEAMRAQIRAQADPPRFESRSLTTTNNSYAVGSKEAIR
jgi:hypothetical protein